jgi:hypothetical protein
MVTIELDQTVRLVNSSATMTLPPIWSGPAPEMTMPGDGVRLAIARRV